jgi:hypothetical protein
VSSRTLAQPGLNTPDDGGLGSPSWTRPPAPRSTWCVKSLRIVVTPQVRQEGVGVAASIRTLLTIGLSALLTATVTVLVVGPLGASGSQATTYRLRLGDYIEIPALDWTCAETSSQARSGAAVLGCSTNDKPISVVSIYPNTIVVAARSTLGGMSSAAHDSGRASAPKRVAHGGYLFPFSQK